MSNDSLSGRVCTQNFNKSANVFFHLIYSANYIRAGYQLTAWILAGEALIRIISKIFKRYLSVVQFALAGREREKKGRKKGCCLDKESSHVLVFVSKTFSELC